MLTTDTHLHWNVHRLEERDGGGKLETRLEKLLNDHAHKGYRVHSIYSWMAGGRQQMRVVFVQAFETEADLEVFRTGSG